jgi:hypothetical protein
MFRIIQTGWNFIDRELSSIFDEYPPNELEMFKEILTEYYEWTVFVGRRGREGGLESRREDCKV